MAGSPHEPPLTSRREAAVGARTSRPPDTWRSSVLAARTARAAPAARTFFFADGTSRAPSSKPARPRPREDRAIDSAASRVITRFAAITPPYAETGSQAWGERVRLGDRRRGGDPHGFAYLMIATVGRSWSKAARTAAYRVDVVVVRHLLAASWVACASRAARLPYSAARWCEFRRSAAARYASDVAPHPLRSRSPRRRRGRCPSRRRRRRRSWRCARTPRAASAALGEVVPPFRERVDDVGVAAPGSPRRPRWRGSSRTRAPSRVRRCRSARPRRPAPRPTRRSARTDTGCSRTSSNGAMPSVGELRLVRLEAEVGQQAGVHAGGGCARVRRATPGSR